MKDHLILNDSIYAERQYRQKFSSKIFKYTHTLIHSYFHSNKLVSNNSETLKLTSHLLQGSTTFFILILLTGELSQSPGSKLEETITSV